MAPVLEIAFRQYFAATRSPASTASTAIAHATVLSAPPSVGASRLDALHRLWTGAGLDAVETRAITVERRFADFDEFWTIGLSSPSLRPMVAAMAPEDVRRLKARVEARLPADAAGRVTGTARANAAKGRVPT